MYVDVHTFVIIKLIIEWGEYLNLMPPQPVRVTSQTIPGKLGRWVAIVGLTIHTIITL